MTHNKHLKEITLISLGLGTGLLLATSPGMTGNTIVTVLNVFTSSRIATCSTILILVLVVLILCSRKKKSLLF
jgi:hypothetical protein